MPVSPSHVHSPKCRVVEVNTNQYKINALLANIILGKLLILYFENKAQDCLRNVYVYVTNYKYTILKYIACRLFIEDDILEVKVRLCAGAFHACARMSPMMRHSYNSQFPSPIL